MATFLLCLLFTMSTLAASGEKLGTMTSMSVIALLIIASVINDGFNKIAKILKEKP